MISLATYYVIVKKGGNPVVYLQIYSYISSSLSLNTKTYGTIVLRHRTAQSIPSFILSSTSTSSHIFVGLLRFFYATTFGLNIFIHINEYKHINKQYITLVYDGIQKEAIRLKRICFPGMSLSLQSTGESFT